MFENEMQTRCAICGTGILLGIFMAGRTEISLAFFGAAVLFLPLFVLVKVIRPEPRED